MDGEVSNYSSAHLQVEEEPHSMCCTRYTVDNASLHPAAAVLLSLLAGRINLNGLSGAPVFASVTSRGGDARPLFAGVVLRGTASSGLVHFLGAETIRHILDEIRARPRKKLPKRWSGGKTRLRRRPSEHE
jgi:hypothetical protein